MTEDLRVQINRMRAELDHRQYVISRDRAELRDICPHTFAQWLRRHTSEFSFYLDLYCPDCGKSWQEKPRG